MDKWCVYVHTNKINNKKYIGISSNVKQRWHSNGYNYYDQVFGNAIQKYGWDNFEHEILYEDLSKEEASKYEQLLIEKYKTNMKKFGYNRSKGGESGSFGAYDAQLNRMVHVFQYDFDGNFIKEHISISSAVRELRPDYNGHNSFNIPTCCKGKRLSALGYRWFYTYQGEKIEPIKSPEERTAMSESKVVYQYTLDGYFVMSYKSVTYAKEITGCTSIQQCANNKLKTAGGFRWFYEYYGERIEPLELKGKIGGTPKKKVYVYDLNMNFLTEYESLHELEQNSLNDFGVLLKTSSVSKVCNGERKKYKNFIFSYTKL